MARSRRPPALTGHVLVADDDDDTRALVCEILGEAGLVVSEARHGLELLDRLSDGTNGIDLVVSDVRMPVLSGVEVLAMISRLDHPPIVLMTGFSEPHLPAVALGLGVAAVLTKPFDGRELLRVVRQHLAAAKPAG